MVFEGKALYIFFFGGSGGGGGGGSRVEAVFLFSILWAIAFCENV